MNRINKPNIAGQMMKSHATGFVMAVCIAVFLFPLASVSAGGQYQIVWSTIGGGGTSSSGQYSLTGTMGQTDAGSMSGGQYKVLGGFWPGGPLCFVNFEDFARFAERWLDTPCDELNDWCGGADLNHLNGVDLIDLDLFVDEWLCTCPYNWPLR